MMKNKSSKIRIVQEEIIQLEESIKNAISTNKKAFAARLMMMKEKKEKLLETWFSTP